MTKVKILFNLLSQDLISEYEKKGHCIILFRFRNSLRPTLINADAKQMDIIFADKVGIVLCKLGLLESIYSLNDFSMKNIHWPPPSLTNASQATKI